jgi:hypothetical protein
MSLSCHPLGLADVFVHTIAVHLLAAEPILLVLLRHDYKLVGRPPAVEPIPGLRILNQPIDQPLKVPVLGQIDPFHLRQLHLLIQNLHVLCGNRYAADMLEGDLDHLLCSIVEHGVGFGLANSVSQTKMFLHAKEN